VKIIYEIFGLTGLLQQPRFDLYARKVRAVKRKGRRSISWAARCSPYLRERSRPNLLRSNLINRS
jgi:hypothetical protein